MTTEHLGEMDRLWSQLSRFSEDWVPPNSEIRYSKAQIKALLKTLDIVSHRLWEIRYQSKDVWVSDRFLPRPASVSERELKDEEKLLEKELIHLGSHLVKASWPWIDGDRQRGKRHSIDAKAWYWVLSRVFLEWKYHVFEKYLVESEGVSGSGYKRKPRSITDQLTSSQIEIELLYWWLRSRGFDLSDKQIEECLLPYIGAGLLYGEARLVMPRRAKSGSLIDGRANRGIHRIWLVIFWLPTYVLPIAFILTAELKWVDSVLDNPLSSEGIMSVLALIVTYFFCVVLIGVMSIIVLGPLLNRILGTNDFPQPPHDHSRF